LLDHLLGDPAFFGHVPRGGCVSLDHRHPDQHTVTHTHPIDHPRIADAIRNLDA
jgi:hypothetical protein